MNPRPRLRADIVVVEQKYRGEDTYIVKDPETHKYFRFRPVEMLVIQEFDGEHTAAEIAAGLQEQGFPFTPDAVSAFARKVSGMGLFERQLSEKSVLLMERLRAERQRRVKNTHYQGSLLRMRWSVGDPDRLFDRLLPRMGFFFSRTFLVASVALFAVYLAIFIANWSSIKAAIAAVYSPSTLTLGAIVVFWVTGLTVIAIHEMGHGLTCKYFGGQVHEMGAMLIYFQPAFYCNVNDAWTFPKLSHRLWVTAAGTWIQLVVAAIAGMVWLVVEPGTLISQIALSALLVGGATTILANANPLIPLDGYYALSDYLEIPNLRHRAFEYLTWLIKRRVLRLAVPEPPADDRERRVFLIYGGLAVVYITMILTLVGGLVFGWVSRAFGAIGGLAFALLLWSMLGDGIRGWAGAVATSVREHGDYWRSRTVWRRAGGGVLVLVLLGLVVPWPITVDGTFRAAPAMDLAVAAGADGVIGRVFVTEGTPVRAGEPLVRLRNFGLEREALRRERRMDSLVIRANQARAAGRTAAAERLAAERAEEEAALAALRARLATLTVRAPAPGVVATPRLEEQVGQGRRAGEAVVRLVDTSGLELRVDLEPAGATLVAAGQPLRLIGYGEAARSLRATVSGVSVAAADAGGRRRVEARVAVAAGETGLRPGATGEARVVVRRSNLFGALWWALRKRLRNDILL